MEAIGIIIALAVVAAIVYFVIRGSKVPAPELGTALKESEPVRPVPPVAEFHVKGDAASVYFEVPLPDGDDAVLGKLLLHEAVEVVREKRHTLPIDQVSRVVAYGQSGDGFAKVGEVSLETPGTLPPPAPPPVVFRHGGPDPLASFREGPSGPPPGVSTSVPEEGLGPAGPEVELPGAVASGLRMQGVDPSTAGAGDLVVGLLKLGGFTVTGPTEKAGYHVYVASNPTGRTYVHVDPLGDADYPELEESAINRFMIDFEQSGTDRGLLVSDKFGPYLVYEKERREPRVHFITRERLQQFVDSLALT